MAALPSFDPEILDALPDQFKQLAVGLPLADLLRLSEAYGGTHLYVPMRLEKSDALVSALGEDATRRLIAYCGGCYLSVPVCEKVRRLLLQREARSLHREGKTLNEIALAMRVTSRTIQTWIRGDRATAHGEPPTST